MAQTGQPGAGPDLSTVITRFYGGTVDQAQPPFRMNAPGSHSGSCLIWNDPVLQNPVNAPWRKFRAIWGTVSTSAVVKNRYPIVTITDNLNTYFTHGDGSYIITASQVNVWISGAIGHPGGNNPGMPSQGFAMPLPDLWLPPGCVFGFGLGQFDAGDVLNEARFLVDEAGPILTSYSQPPKYLFGTRPKLTG